MKNPSEDSLTTTTTSSTPSASTASTSSSVHRALNIDQLQGRGYAEHALVAVETAVRHEDVGVRIVSQEVALRENGNRAAGESFIAYWLRELIYYDFPVWIFTLAYTVFGGLVALMWFLAPPGPVKGSEFGGQGPGGSEGL